MKALSQQGRYVLSSPFSALGGAEGEEGRRGNLSEDRK